VIRFRWSAPSGTRFFLILEDHIFFAAKNKRLDKKCPPKIVAFLAKWLI